MTYEDEDKIEYRGVTCYQRYARVRPSELERDDYYRDLIGSHARRTKDEWEDALVDSLVVVEVPDGRKIQVDGMHKATGGLERDVESMWARIIRGDLSYEDRARMCHDLQMRRRGLNAVEAFVHRLGWKEPEAVAIQGIVEAAGFKITKSTKAGGFKCIRAIERAYSIDSGASLAKALGVLREAWGHLGEVIHGHVVVGVALAIDAGVPSTFIQAFLEQRSPDALKDEAKAVAKESKGDLSGQGGPGYYSTAFKKAHRLSLAITAHQEVHVEALAYVQA